MRGAKLSFLLIILACAVACSDDDSVSWVVPEDPSALVLQNLETVRAAAEAFAEASDGWYPADVDVDTTPDGMTLVDLLPAGERLINPYTGDRREPQNGLAERAGEIGYRPIDTGYAVDYEILAAFEINAFDATGEIARIDNLEDLVARTIEMTHIVASAATEFMRANRGYSSANVAGFQDRLPDGMLLQNPFLLARTEPIEGAGASSGQVGYVPNFPSGFQVNGVTSLNGHAFTTYTLKVPDLSPADEEIWYECYRVFGRARDFAVGNDGAYPLDVSSDTRQDDGRTLHQLLGGYITNPYTGLATEPRDGFASGPGEIGYQPVIWFGAVIDCRVTGFGADGRIVTLPPR